MAETPLASSAEPSATGSLDRHISHGIGGTFIIAVATLPFGYLISLILARVSLEAVGAYSLLGIYLAGVASLLYLGGGTVTMRFTANLPMERRLPFFFTYLALTFAVWALAQAVFSAFPGTILTLLGVDADGRFWPALFLVAPLPLFWFASLATLQGLLLPAVAKLLERSLTVGACVVYASLYIFAPETFRRHSTILVMAPYLALILVASAVAFARILRAVRGVRPRWSWRLPHGFWAFALIIQLSSTLMLLQQRVDQIVVAATFGVAELGVYFVLVQLAEGATLLAIFFTEGVFPAMVSLDVLGRRDKILALYDRSARYLLLAGAVTLYTLFAGHQFVLALFGEPYRASSDLFLLLLVFNSLDVLGPLNQTVIVSLRKAHSWTAIQGARVITFAVLVAFLGPWYGLTGTVLARGLAWTVAGALAFAVVRYRLPVRPAIPRQYIWHVVICVALGAAGLLWPVLFSSPAGSCLILAGALSLFLQAGGYRFREWQQLRELWPGVPALRR
jgi:hypothetical protein